MLIIGKIVKQLDHWFQVLPVYPLLLGVYPVLFLWSANYVQVPGFAVLRSLLISLAITFIVCLASFALSRKLLQAAIIAGLVLILFFTYGQFFSLVDNQSLFGFNFGRHRYILLVWVFFLAAGVFFILRSKSDLRSATRTINLVSIFLIILTVVQLGTHIANDPSLHSNQVTGNFLKNSSLAAPSSRADTPDVYYFLLDGYDRQDLMQQDAHLDNQAFISDLENLGFEIPDCTQSNYTTTITSMAATLNMKYIDQLGVANSEIATLKLNAYTSLLEPYTLNNLVMKNFKELGYQIVTLKNDYPFIDFPNSDVYYDYQSASSSLDKLEAYNFEYIFLRTTVMRVLIEETEYSPDKFKNLPTPVLELINPRFNRNNSIIKQIFQRNLYDLHVMENISRLPGKKFVYAHLLVTHPPFAFTSSGELKMDTLDTIQSYADQVTYANKRMLTIIKNILAGSKTPPVIILQGDHGHSIDNLKDVGTFKILNAYYLPGNGKDKLYSQITPVNSFRLIFSNYFNLDYPLLPDQSIWINPTFPGGYKIAPQTCVQ